jgi:hypothetical protein
MSDNFHVIATALVFLSVAVVTSAIGYRLLYPRKSKMRASSGSAWAIHDESNARKVARQGMWGAFIVALVTGVASFLSGAGVQAFKGIGPTAWLDAIIFAALGVGIGKMSRAAAIGALVLYVVEQVAMTPVAGLSPVTMVAMVACFVQGVRGTWAFHKFRQQPPGMMQGSAAT